MRQTTMPPVGDDFRAARECDPCVGVRSIGEIISELLGTIDVGERQTDYAVAGPFRLAAVSGRTTIMGR
jgi:hypothetical protein